MKLDKEAKTIRVPVKVVGGRLTYLYGGDLPALKEGIVGDLVLPAFGVVADDVRQRLLSVRAVPLLQEATPLLVRISCQSIPTILGARVVRETLDGVVNTPCVRVVLLEPLAMLWRAGKPGSLKPVKCEIPALRKLQAGSVNQAYRLVSEAFEPHRRSHSANVFQEVFFQAGQHWRHLEDLRSRAERDLEPLLAPKSPNPSA